MKKINFVRHRTTFYEQVQTNIFSLIGKHLPKNETSSTVEQVIEDKNSINLSLFIRTKADVLMSHGVADKNYLFMKNKNGVPMINKFSHVCVPGPWLKKRLLEAPEINLQSEQIHTVGWPRLDLLLELRTAQVNSSSSLLSRFKKIIFPIKKKVVWAPTHNNVDKNVKINDDTTESPSSYPGLNEYLEKLEAMFDFDAALHPRNRKKGNRAATTDLLACADIVISDFGTMVYEAWGLGIPVIFPRWLLRDKVIEQTPNSAEAFIFENNIGLHANSFEELCYMAKKNKVIGDDVKKFMADYLPTDYLGKSGERLASVLQHECIR